MTGYFNNPRAHILENVQSAVCQCRFVVNVQSTHVAASGSVAAVLMPIFYVRRKKGCSQNVHSAESPYSKRLRNKNQILRKESRRMIQLQYESGP
jgi:hypothetical protein